MKTILRAFSLLILAVNAWAGNITFHIEMTFTGTGTAAHFAVTKTGGVVIGATPTGGARTATLDFTYAHWGGGGASSGQIYSYAPNGSYIGARSFSVADNGCVTWVIPSSSPNPYLPSYSPGPSYACYVNPTTNYWVNLSYTNTSGIPREICADAQASGTNTPFHKCVTLLPGQHFDINHTNSAPFTMNVYAPDAGFSTDFQPSLGTDQSVLVPSTGTAVPSGPATDGSDSDVGQGDPFVPPAEIPPYVPPEVPDQPRGTNYVDQPTAAQTQDQNADARSQELKDLLVGLQEDERGRDNIQLQASARAAEQEHQDNKAILDKLGDIEEGITNSGAAPVLGDAPGLPGYALGTNGAISANALISGLPKTFSVALPSPLQLVIPISAVGYGLTDKTLDFSASEIAPTAALVRGFLLLIVTVAFLSSLTDWSAK